MCFQGATPAPVAEIRGEIGGNLTFRCPDDKSKSITFFYFQKKAGDTDVYINGYYTNRPIDKQTWNNTRMDQDERTTVHMFNLKASDEGDYMCIIEYSDMSHNKTSIKATVTGEMKENQSFMDVVEQNYR